MKAAAVLPAGYVKSASLIADRRIILAGYRLSDLFIRVTQKLKENSLQFGARDIVHK